RPGPRSRDVHTPNETPKGVPDTRDLRILLCAHPSAPAREEPAMAKIGTAHIEVKPVANEGALDALCESLAQRIEDAVAAGVERGMKRGQVVFGDVHIQPADADAVVRTLRKRGPGTAI